MIILMLYGITLVQTMFSGLIIDLKRDLKLILELIKEHISLLVFYSKLKMTGCERTILASCNSVQCLATRQKCDPK